jgi:recombinational DNA repair protein (RecF pathway)
MCHCSRCGTNTSVITMSYFNTDMICMECDKAEQAHPAYEEAKEKELEQCRMGNFNFEGIGKPEGL